MSLSAIFFSLFLLLFLCIWIVFSALLAKFSGWQKLAKNNPLKQKNNYSEIIDFSSIQFNSIGSYNYGILITLYEDGMGLEPKMLFKAFHKPIYIPWKKISKIEATKEFFWFPALDIFVDGNKIRFYGKTAEAITSNYTFFTAQQKTITSTSSESGV